jgi:hypothetical protein
MRFSGGNTLMDNGGYLQNGESIRTPIFYDSNNTGYYGDFASTSNISDLVVRAGTSVVNITDLTTGTAPIRVTETGTGTGDVRYIPMISGTSTSSSGYRQHTVLGSVRGTAWGAAFIAVGGNDSYPTVAYTFHYDGYATAPSSFRAPIFYDSNNTGYYTDQASTSNYNVLAVQRAYAGYDAGVTNSFSCSDWFRSSGSTGWYNASYGGGIYMEDSTWVRVYASKAFYVANQIAATGNITAYYSDERLKTKTGDITNAVDKVNNLKGFYYIENELAKSFGYKNEKQQIALSAQDVQKVVPEAVHLAPFDMKTVEETGEIISKSGENYLTVDYAKLVPLLVEAIKEQNKEVVDLRAKVERLESLISKLIDV